mmetsp:Transcript_51121/g.128321  ORF Transcript_51121/g.128321 Transcript_51121/m.128321 type:complete len:304 (-) Transcript_51121:1540-2451(-)
MSHKYTEAKTRMDNTRTGETRTRTHSHSLPPVVCEGNCVWRAALELHRKSGEFVEALLHPVEAVLVPLERLLQKLPTHLVCLLVDVVEFDALHVFLHFPHQRQLEERLSKQLYLVADLRPDESKSLVDERLHLLDGLVHLRGLDRNVADPPRQYAVNPAACTDLHWYSRLGVLKTRQRLLKAIRVLQDGAVLLEEHPGIAECGCHCVGEKVQELMHLTLNHRVKCRENQIFDHLIVHHELDVLCVQSRIHVLVSRPLEPAHEIDDHILLQLKKPPHSVGHILDSLLHGQVCLVGKQLHDDVSP